MEVTRAAEIGVQLLGTVDGAEPEVDTLAVLTVGSMCLNAGGISKENITLAF